MKRFAIGLTCVLFCLFVMTPAQATPVAVNDIITVKDWGPGGGGEIIYHNYSTQDTFTTFCLEKGVYIYPGYDYQVTDISNNVISGGVTGLTVLAGQTKWLFYEWAMGSLKDYDKDGVYGQEALQFGRLQGDLPQGADLHYGRHRQRSRHLCAQPCRSASDSDHLFLHFE